MLELPFFTNFLKISNPLTIAGLFTLAVSFFILFRLKKGGASFPLRLMVALFLGLILGTIFDLLVQNFTPYIASKNEIGIWFSLFGTGFVKLIGLIAVPVVFLSIIDVLINLQGGNLKKLSAKTLFMLLGTTAIAAIIAISVVEFLNIDASGFAGEVDSGRVNKMKIISSSSFPQFFLDIVPNNILSVASTNNSIISVVIVTVMIASAVRILKQKEPEIIAPFITFLTSAKYVINSVLMNVLKLMPYGVVALVAATIVKNGINAIITMIGFIVALYIAILLMLIIYAIILLLNGLSPIKFYKNALVAMIFAFSSRSSVGTLPLTLQTLEKNMGVSKQTGDFVSTLGTTIGMNGCAGVFPAILGILLAKAVGVEIDFGFYTLLVMVVTLGSIGIAGVPGTATVAATVTLNGIGLGNYMNNIAAVFGVDPILDMGRTMLNVTGAMLSATIIDKSEGRLDIAKYNSKNEKITE